MAARTGGRIRVRAFAKINLSLQVLGLRVDGYHDLRTIFQTLALHDTLTFARTDGPFEIRCHDPRCPVDRSNLVWRAAELVWRAAGRRGQPAGVSVGLVKRIPTEAGLGGGSSDGAAAIAGLAKLWRVVLGPSRHKRIARRLGADVPFFIEGGTALGTGRGDRLRRLPDTPASWVLLALPDFGVRTKEAYAWWDEDLGQGRPVLDMREHHGASASGAGVGPRASEKSGAPRELRKVGHRAFINDLQPPVAARHPEISEIVAALERAGASVAAMSGSGSAVFGLFKTRRAAANASRSLAVRTVMTRTLDRRSAEARGRPEFL